MGSIDTYNCVEWSRCPPKLHYKNKMLCFEGNRETSRTCFLPVFQGPKIRKESSPEKGKHGNNNATTCVKTIIGSQDAASGSHKPSCTEITLPWWLVEFSSLALIFLQF